MATKDLGETKRFCQRLSRYTHFAIQMVDFNVSYRRFHSHLIQYTTPPTILHSKSVSRATYLKKTSIKILLTCVYHELDLHVFFQKQMCVFQRGSVKEECQSRWKICSIWSTKLLRLFRGFRMGWKTMQVPAVSVK